MVALLILLTLVAAISIFTSYRFGYWKGHVAGAKCRLDRDIRISKAGGGPLSIEAFEEHCHTTVVSNLYGTPDWFTHICFKKFGEAGELAEHVGKASRDDGWSIFKGPKNLTAERRMAILKEIGDGWWYDMMILKELGSTPREAMLINIEKRESRIRRGTMHGSGDNR